MCREGSLTILRGRYTLPKDLERPRMYIWLGGKAGKGGRAARKGKGFSIAKEGLPSAARNLNRRKEE